MKTAVIFLCLLLAACATDPVTEKYYETRSACHKVKGHMFTIMHPEEKISTEHVPDENDDYYCRLGASNIIF